MKEKEKFDKVKYTNDYMRKHYDALRINVKKGKRTLLKEYAEKNGTTVNGLINSFIDSLPLE